MFEGTPPFNTGWAVVHHLMKTSMDFKNTELNLYSLDVARGIIQNNKIHMKQKNTFLWRWKVLREASILSFFWKTSIVIHFRRENPFLNIRICQICAIYGVLRWHHILKRHSLTQKHLLTDIRSLCFCIKWFLIHGLASCRQSASKGKLIFGSSASGPKATVKCTRCSRVRPSSRMYLGDAQEIGVKNHCGINTQDEQIQKVLSYWCNLFEYVIIVSKLSIKDLAEIQHWVS